MDRGAWWATVHGIAKSWTRFSNLNVTNLKVAQSCLTLRPHGLYAATAKSLQSCPTLCDPIDGSPPGSPVPGILQARTLEWVAISFSSAWKWKVKVKSLSHVRLLATPWTAAYQAPPSMGFSRQEYWSGVPLPSPMDYIGHGILQARILEWVAFPFSRGSLQPRNPTQVFCTALQADSLPVGPPGKP